MALQPIAGPSPSKSTTITVTGVPAHLKPSLDTLHIIDTNFGPREKLSFDYVDLGGHVDRCIQLGATVFTASGVQGISYFTPEAGRAQYVTFYNGTNVDSIVAVHTPSDGIEVRAKIPVKHVSQLTAAQAQSHACDVTPVTMPPSDPAPCTSWCIGFWY